MILSQRRAEDPLNNFQHSLPNYYQIVNLSGAKPKQQKKAQGPSKQRIQGLEYRLLLNTPELQNQTLTSKLFHYNPCEENYLYTAVECSRKSKIIIKALCPNVYIQKLRIIYFILLTEAYDSLKEYGIEGSLNKSLSPTSTSYTIQSELAPSKNNSYDDNYQKYKRFRTALNILRVNFYEDESLKGEKQKYLAEFFQFLQYDYENLQNWKGNQQEREKQNIVINLMNKYPIMDQIMIDMLIYFIEKNSQTNGGLNLDDNFNIKVFVQQRLRLKIQFISNWDFILEDINVHVGVDQFGLDFCSNSYIQEIIENLEKVDDTHGLDVSNVGEFEKNVFDKLDKSYINDLKDVLTNSICSDKSIGNEGSNYPNILSNKGLKQSQQIYVPITSQPQHFNTNSHQHLQIQSRPSSNMSKTNIIHESVVNDELKCPTQIKINNNTISKLKEKNSFGFLKGMDNQQIFQQNNILARQKSFSHIQRSAAPSSSRIVSIKANNPPENTLSSSSNIKNENGVAKNLIRELYSQHKQPQSRGKFQQIRQKILEKSVNQNKGNESSRQIKGDNNISNQLPNKINYLIDTKTERKQKSFKQVQKDIAKILENINQNFPEKNLKAIQKEYQSNKARIIYPPKPNTNFNGTKSTNIIQISNPISNQPKQNTSQFNSQYYGQQYSHIFKYPPLQTPVKPAPVEKGKNSSKYNTQGKNSSKPKDNIPNTQLKQPTIKNIHRIEPVPFTLVSNNPQEVKRKQRPFYFHEGFKAENSQNNLNHQHFYTGKITFYRAPPLNEKKFQLLPEKIPQFRRPCYSVFQPPYFSIPNK